MVEGTDINTLIDNKIGSSTSATAVISCRAYALNTIGPNTGNFISNTDFPSGTDGNDENSFPYVIPPFELVEYNFGNAYSTTTYKFTAPETGLYHVILNVSYQELFILDLLKEQITGVIIRKDRVRGDPSDTTSLNTKSLNTIIYLQSGEKVFTGLFYGELYLGGFPGLGLTSTDNKEGGFIVHYLGPGDSTYTA